MGKLGDESSLPWMLGGIFVAFVAATAFAFSPIAGAVLIGPILALAVFTRRPKMGFVFWLVSVAAVPCWVGVTAGAFLPATLIGSVVALTCLFAGSKWVPNKADVAVVSLLVAAAIGAFIGSESGVSSMSAFVSMFTLWVPGYLVGRFVCQKAGLSFVRSSVAMAFGVVGLLAAIEAATSWHIFSSHVGMNSLADIWAPIQVRGGVDRSEWAFGHSIALGGSLALAIPFLLSSGLKTKTKFVLLAFILLGVASTLSRGAMIAAGITLVLALLTTPNLKSGHKTMLMLAAGLLGTYFVTGFLEVSEEAGDEVSNSSGYRVTLLTNLISSLAPFGRASTFAQDAHGNVQYGYFTSIDNSFMALGLGFGWVAMLAAALPFLVMGVRLMRGRASFAEVALLGQLPVITTVAMITQYQVLVWMVAGLAATLAATNLPRPLRELPISRVKEASFK